jgi:hypothetical protein
MRATVRRKITLTLNEDDALDLLEYLVRAHRLTDGARSCPLPVRACATGEEFRDTLGVALDLGSVQAQAARFPRSAVEDWAQDLRYGVGHLGAPGADRG